MSDNAQLMNQAREIKTMGTYCSKLNLKNPKHAEMLLTQVVERATFTSPYAKPFEDRIRQLAMGNVEGHSCIICKKNEAINGVFCSNCMAIIIPDEERKAQKTRGSFRANAAQRESTSSATLNVKGETSATTSTEDEVSDEKSTTGVPANEDGKEQKVRKLSVISPTFRTKDVETSEPTTETEETKEKPDKKPIMINPVAIAVCVAALVVVLAVKFFPQKANDPDITMGAVETAAINPKELTTVLSKPETDISESIKDTTRKEYDNDGEIMPVLEADDGSVIGLDENDQAYYIELTKDSDTEATIAGVRIGDNVHQAAHMFEQAGAVEDIQAEQYWAELFFNDGQPNIYILCFNYAVPDSDKIIAFMATIDRDTVIGVSAEVK